MSKRKMLADESQIYKREKTKPTKKVGKRTKRIEVEWSHLFRFAIMLFFVGVVVFHYYLITEKALLSYYQSIWSNHKQTLSPVLIFLGYSFLIFLVGYYIGKKRK
ncbi:hypothetical protein R4Z10_11330 [Niallia sp. XMNu-256]|uniref:hypothetical protein n=1 Tax=Niallia sp. XMNu-256 TaxID=3082444 RepID=UPI0030D04C76